MGVFRKININFYTDRDKCNYECVNLSIYYLIITIIIYNN